MVPYSLLEAAVMGEPWMILTPYSKPRFLEGGGTVPGTLSLSQFLPHCLYPRIRKTGYAASFVLCPANIRKKKPQKTETK